MCFQNGTCLYVEDVLCVCVSMHACACIWPQISFIFCACTWPKISFIFFCKMLWKNPNDPFGQPYTQRHTHTCTHRYMHACMPALVWLSSTPEITACEGKEGWSALFHFSRLSSQAPLTTLLSPVKRNWKQPQAFIYRHLLSLQLSLWRYYLLQNLITSSLWRAPRLALSPQSLLQVLDLLLPALTVRLSSLNEWTALLGHQPEGPKPSCSSFLSRWPFFLLLVLPSLWAARPCSFILTLHPRFSVLPNTIDSVAAVCLIEDIFLTYITAR